MPYVVTRSCCADASCVVACPVNCIHPAPGEPGFGTSEMVYVDPKSCVDCGACVTACPVDAIKPHTKLTDAELPFLALNAQYFEDNPHYFRTPLALVPPVRRLTRPLRVAVVGSGPAGLYAADELLKHAGVEVDVFERLEVPHGLARFGVAPDHEDTRLISDRLFTAIEQQPGFRYRLGVEVGRDITHDELTEKYGAVVYAVGAATDRTLGIPGESLPGCASATAFVAWYNNHPEQPDCPIPLDIERLVVIGNGNVALDVARMSGVPEVVVLGRRGPEDAAFTLPELIALAGRDDLDVVVEGGVPVVDAKTELLAELADRPLREGRRRIVLRFHTTPERVLGDDHVTGLATSSGDIEAGAVLRAVGYRAVPVLGLPFDEDTATVPHEAGRVAPGVYVVGWIKRGPRGFIGTNKSCAEETVASILDDLEAGLLLESPEPVRRRRLSLPL